MIKKKKKPETVNENKFRHLIENIRDGIISVDENWTIIYINKNAEQMLNRPAGELLGKNLWEEFPESVGKPFYNAYHEALLSQKSIYLEEYSASLKKWTHAAIYPSPFGLSIYFHDVTEQRSAEKKAKETEDNYRLFIDRITDGFIALDKNFCYIYANKKVGEMVQRDPESLVGKNVWELFPEAVGSNTYKAFHTAMKEQRFISNVDHFEPLNLWQENYIYPSPEGLSIFIRDITERKRLENELREQERKQQLQIIATALEAEEKERTHIGQELHDNVNQLIVATKMMSALIRDDPGKLTKLIPQCIDNLEKAIQENRKIAHELVTPDLKQQGLTDQMNFLTETMLVSNGIQAEVLSMDFDETLIDESRKLAAYRIAQEQCTNIVKHSKATNVKITLSTSQVFFKMFIADNGQGMKLSKAAKGIGFKNMQGRLGIFYGTMRIHTKPGDGFKLEIRIPIGE